MIGATTDDPGDEPLPAEEAEYFNPDNRACSRIQFWLDRPEEWSKNVRHVHISGWCLAVYGEPVTAVRFSLS